MEITSELIPVRLQVACIKCGKDRNSNQVKLSLMIAAGKVEGMGKSVSGEKWGGGDGGQGIKGSIYQLGTATDYLDSI